VTQLESWGLLMAENKMEQVAKMFDKKFGELFKLQKFIMNEGYVVFVVQFTDDGLLVFDESRGVWSSENGLLEDMICGRVEIFKNEI
jgi:hypothetical protein